jgi:hypothetical protein
MFVIRPWEKIFPWMQAFPAERALVVMTLIVMMLDGRLTLRMNGQSLAVLLFFGTLVLSGVTGLNPDASSQRLYVYLTLVIFYFILVSVIRSPYELATILLWWLGVMWLYVAKALWEYKNGAHDFKQGVPRLIGIENTYGDPNECAAVICFTLPALFFAYRLRQTFFPTGSTGSRIFRLGLASYLVMAPIAIMLTNSRSGMLKLLAFVLTVVLYGRGGGRRLARIGVTLALFLSIWVVMPSTSRNRFRTLWDKDAGPDIAHGSAYGRLEGLLMGYHTFERYPVLGVGIGNFRAYRVRNLDGKDLEPHNLPGQVLAETGIMGTGTFILMTVITLSNCRRTVVLARRYQDPTLDILAAVAWACFQIFVLMLFASLAGNVLYHFHWLWMAAFSSLCCRFATEKVQEKQLCGHLTGPMSGSVRAFP